MSRLWEYARKAKESGRVIAGVDSSRRSGILGGISKRLVGCIEQILEANSRDVDAAECDGLAKPLLDRLRLTREKILEMARGVESVEALPDPLGVRTLHRELDSGLVLERITVPIGVIGVIFESRPDALVQISSLCIKSGNAVILKGGREAKNTNRILHQIIVDSAVEIEPAFSDSLILLESREEIGEMLGYNEFIDLIIPRGSNQLVQTIMSKTKIPVMGHADGICHAYLDKSNDLDASLAVIKDSKCQYPAVCNSLETLLVHRANCKVLSDIRSTLEGVELRGDEEVAKWIDCTPASSEDWETEYNDLILSIKVVESLSDAIMHINRHGSGHTDVILTTDEARADRFLSEVDSASVLWNCSTRFADGYRYGFGAEVGIATGKLHSRGPVGLQGLTSYRYRLKGDGHLVADYVSGKQTLSHRELS